MHLFNSSKVSLSSQKIPNKIVYLKRYIKSQESKAHRLNYLEFPMHVDVVLSLKKIALSRLKRNLTNFNMSYVIRVFKQRLYI